MFMNLYCFTTEFFIINPCCMDGTCGLFICGCFGALPEVRNAFVIPTFVENEIGVSGKEESLLITFNLEIHGSYISLDSHQQKVNDGRKRVDQE